MLRVVLRRTAATKTINEVDKFAAMSADWWDQSGSNAALHSLNALRIGFINEIHGDKLKDLTILDVGCGGGILAEGLARRGARVMAIDPNETLLEVAESRRKRYGLDNLSYHDFVIEDLQDSETKFDIVISSEVIEHITEPWSFTAYCTKMVKPEGDLIMTTLNRTFMSRLMAIELAERWGGLLPAGTHDHDMFVTINEMIMDLREVDFHVEHLRGMRWNPLVNRWTWTSDVDCNYLVHAKR